MANENVIEANDQRSLFTVANDLEGVRDQLRIMQEMVIDAFCNSTPSDTESTFQLHERVLFLMGQLPRKLAEMTQLNQKLYALCGITQPDAV